MLKPVLTLTFHTNGTDGYLEISNERLLAYVPYEVRRQISNQSRKDARAFYLSAEDAEMIVTELNKNCVVKLTKRQYSVNIPCQNFQKAV